MPNITVYLNNENYKKYMFQLNEEQKENLKDKFKEELRRIKK